MHWSRASLAGPSSALTGSLPVAYEPSMAKRFAGKVAVVTGGSAGIGAAVARLFAAEAAAVVVAARGVEALERVAAEIRSAGGNASAFATDVADRGACERLLDHAEATFGGVDVLVNNAGANKRGPIELYSAEELAAVIRVNLVAPIVLTRLAVPLLRKRGGGAIVNVASIAGMIPVDHEAVYCATKFGLRAFTFALAEELREAKITVSAVSPGPVETGFILEDLDHVPDLVFAQPMSTAEQVAALVLDCAADGARERTIPRITGALATAGYLLPGMRKWMLPLMERQGRKVKETYRRKLQLR
jgi:short-subunit dehydrogenase